MEAVRCMQCGETRWSLMPDALAHLLEAPCELCGGETVVEERRRPGAGPDTLAVERRRAAFVARMGQTGTGTTELAAH